jgi:hypothetical protein
MPKQRKSLSLKLHLQRRLQRRKKRDYSKKEKRKSDWLLRLRHKDSPRRLPLLPRLKDSDLRRKKQRDSGWLKSRRGFKKKLRKLSREEL